MIVHNVTKVRLAPVANQPITSYSFTLTVKELIKLGRIDRLKETEGGVQRRQNSQHVQGIVKSLADSSVGATLSQNVICEIVGGFAVFDEVDRTLELGSGIYLSMLDGGSRYQALSVLPNRQQETTDITVVAHCDLTFEQRLQIFEQQTHARRVDARHMLALTHAAGSWEKPLDREIYELLLMMNGDPNSPLYQKISFQEEEHNYAERHRPAGANVVGLMPTFRKVFGSISPLGKMSPEQRQKYVFNLFNASRRIWAKSWDSNSHILTTARGMKSLMLLLTNSPAYTGFLGTDFSADRIQQAIELARTYQWDVHHNKGKTVEQIVASLNQSIARKANA